jgi:hypothetical protein
MHHPTTPSLDTGLISLSRVPGPIAGEGEKIKKKLTKEGIIYIIVI